MSECAKTSLKVCRKFKPWDSDAVRRASVNNFGFGGTNVGDIGKLCVPDANRHQAHVIMEEAIDRPDGVLSEFSSKLGNLNNTSAMKLATTRLVHFVYLFSANDPNALQRQISLVASYVKERPITLYPQLLTSLAYTLGQRRSSLAWRIAVPASTQEGLIKSLKDVALTPMKAMEQPTIGYVFTGQGAQWPTMGMCLYLTSSTYARSLDRASKFLSKLGASWSLVEEIEKDQNYSIITKPHLSQPACTAVQMALVDLFSSWGIKPASVCGHSSGEIAAAYAAGILDFESCIAIAYYRGVVSILLAENLGNGAGGMLAIGASQQETQDLIDAAADAGVRVACVNSPSSTTISGDIEGISLMQDLADKKSIWNRRLHVDVAYHSQHMELVSRRYGEHLGELHPNASVAVDFFSSLRGCKVDPKSLTNSYWVENLKSPVLFCSAMGESCKATAPDGRRGVDILIEIGPHSALQGPVRQILQSLGGKYDMIRYFPSLKRNEGGTTSLLRLASLLWMNGYRLDMGQINFPDLSSAPPSVLIDLPPYQWNHCKRYWHDGRINLEKRSYCAPRHDLLGNRVADSNALEPQWTNMLVADDVPWLRDHKVEDLIIFPAAGYICMALEACRQQAKWRDVKYDRIVFRDISILRAMAIPDSGSIEVRLSLVPFSESATTVSDTWYQFKVFSWAIERGWAEHCRGLVAAVMPPHGNDVEGKAKDKVGMEKDIERLRQQTEGCAHSIDPKKAYDRATEAGFEVGPIFRGVKQVMMGPSKATYIATIPDTAACMPYNHESEYILHPIGLDFLFQGAVFFLTSFDENYAVPYLPVAIQEITILTGVTWKAGSQMQVYGRCAGGDMISGNRVYDYAGIDGSAGCGILVKGIVEVPIQSSRIVQDVESSRCLQVQWEPCMSYLTPTQFKKVLAPYSPEPGEVDEFQMLEDLSYHYIKEALRQIDPESVTAQHLIRLFDWMKTEAQLLDHQNGRQFHPGDSVFRLLHESAETMNTTIFLVRDVGEKLTAILEGHVEPHTLFPPDDPLGHVGGLGGYERLCAIAAQYFEKLRHQNHRLRVLVIGEETAAAVGVSMLKSTGGLSCSPGQPAQFDFGDRNPDFSDGMKAKLAPITHLINHKTLDIEESPAAQGFETGSYDLVMSCNIFDTASERCTLANIRSLLTVGGHLLSLETNNFRNRLSSFPYATLPTSRAIARNVKEELHMNGRSHCHVPCEMCLKLIKAHHAGDTEPDIQTELCEERWDERLRQHQFSGLDGRVQDFPKHPEKAASVICTTAIPGPENFNGMNPEIVLVSQRLPHGITKGKIEAGLSICGPGNVTWIEFVELTNAKLDGKYCIIIDDPISPFLTTMTCDSFDGLKRLPQTSGVLWITGALLSPDAGLVKGLARTIRAEFQINTFVTLAIDKWDMLSSNVIEIIGEVFKRSFQGPSQEFEHQIETELVFEDGVVRIPRLVQDVNMDQCLLRETHPKARYLQPFAQKGRPLKLTVANPGFLDSLCFIDDEQATKELQDNEIEIDIKAAGLNFKDVILALGQLAGNHLGQECSGVITKIGRKVTGLRPGDRVCAVTPSAIANLGRCPAHCAVPIPDTMSFAEAASIPIIYCTAYYCLIRLANLQHGETVLIHAAAGGVGQAAIMIALVLGAKILATVGHVDKKVFLMRTYGIPEDCIFYSRDTSFAQGVLDATNGAGVDVALSSLAGEQLRATWQCMAPFGRFVEIGKRDIMTNMNLQMAPFERSVSFMAFDLSDLIRSRPEQMRQIFSEIMELLRQNTIRPVAPIHEFPVSQAETAFRSLQSGKPMGKVVLVPKGDDTVMVIILFLQKTEYKANRVLFRLLVHKTYQQFFEPMPLT